MGNTARHNIKLTMYSTCTLHFQTKVTVHLPIRCSNSTIVSKKGQNNENTMYACKNYNYRSNLLVVNGMICKLG